MKTPAARKTRHVPIEERLHPDLLETARVLAEIELRRLRDGRSEPEPQPVVLQPVDWVRCSEWLVRRGYEASFRRRIGLAPVGVQWGTKVAEALDARVNARVPRRVKDDLAALSRRRGVEESELARALLDEALRREKHPGIVFRSTPAGREAAIEGRRVYVWQVIETVRASDGKTEQAASYLGLRPEQVRAAVSYYAEYKREIDSLIALNKEEADRARRLWEREKRALGS